MTALSLEIGETECASFIELRFRLHFSSTSSDSEALVPE